jgi:hypothetical protein
VASPVRKSCGTPDPRAKLICREEHQEGSAMTRAEDCRRRAKEAEELAAKARDPVAKSTYLKVAEQWRLMAEQLEAQGW